jgi:hypothetical protein
VGDEGGDGSAREGLDSEVAHPLLLEDDLARAAVEFDVARLVEGPAAGVDVDEIGMDQPVQPTGGTAHDGVRLGTKDIEDLAVDAHRTVTAWLSGPWP